MKNKFIIIIPCYNVEKWISLNLRLVKMQSYKRFECVIIDDGSSDNTVKIIKREIEEDSRFTLIQNKKRERVVWYEIRVVKFSMFPST